MPRTLMLEPSTSAMYAKWAQEAAAESEKLKAELTKKCMDLYQSVSERISKIDMPNLINAQNNDTRHLCELRDVLKQVSKDLESLSKLNSK